MDSLSVSEAAERLGVNERRVRQLIGLGRLSAYKVGRQWIVDPTAVDQMRRVDRRAGRPYSSRNAWGLLMLAASREAAWLSNAERTRLRDVLESKGILWLLPRLSRRSEVRRWYVHPSLLEHLSADARTVVSGAAAVDSLIDESLVDIYMPSSAEQQIVSEYFVESGPDRPNVLARLVDGPWPFAPGQQVADPVVAAADLLERASDPRSVQVANELLSDA